MSALTRVVWGLWETAAGKLRQPQPAALPTSIVPTTWPRAVGKHTPVKFIFLHEGTPGTVLGCFGLFFTNRKYSLPSTDMLWGDCFSPPDGAGVAIKSLYSLLSFSIKGTPGSAYLCLAAALSRLDSLKTAAINCMCSFLSAIEGSPNPVI